MDKPVRSRQLHRGRVVDLRAETVRLPNGMEMEFEVVRHPGAAAALPLDADQRVCLIRQYRPPVGWIWELPAGKIDPGEEPLAAARRELEEETGVRARRWDALGAILTAPAFSDEVIHLYLARELEAGTVRREPGEVLEVHWLPWNRVLDMARGGEIPDAKTLAAIFRASWHPDTDPGWGGRERW
ncbi:MAG TPA: NUDIX hydrolase [Gammaproteobacteria bacterium]|nr:NUDIX hydrolase [Gammaproteobacteria bacterium]